MGLASSGGSFYWAPRVAGLACGGRIYPGPRAWWWRSLRRPAAAGAGVGGGGAGEGGRDALTVRCRMGATARCRIARRVDGAQLECVFYGGLGRICGVALGERHGSTARAAGGATGGAARLMQASAASWLVPARALAEGGPSTESPPTRRTGHIPQW